MRDNLQDTAAAQVRLGGIGKTKLFELIRNGDLRSVTIGRRRFIPDSAIDEYIANRTNETSEVAS